MAAGALADPVCRYFFFIYKYLFLISLFVCGPLGLWLFADDCIGNLHNLNLKEGYLWVLRRPMSYLR